MRTFKVKTQMVGAPLYRDDDKKMMVYVSDEFDHPFLVLRLDEAIKLAGDIESAIHKQQNGGEN